MNPIWKQAIKEAMASAPSDVIEYETIEVRQTGVQDPIFLVQARQELVAFDENGIERTFEPAGFQLSLPPANEEGARSLDIAIDNIDRRVSAFVALAKSEPVSVEVVYRPYVSTDLTQPQMDPPLILRLTDLDLTPLQVTAKATFMDFVNKKFPTELYTRARFPALG